MNIHQLRELARYWQKRLNIPEWKVTVRWTKRGERPNDDGYCTWYVERLEADILIRRGSPDVHQTLIHELLHLVMDGHPHGDYCEEKYSRFHEQSINRIANALLELWRAEQRTIDTGE